MLLSAKKLLTQIILGSDQAIGTLQDVFFTETSGNVRFLAVKTGGWLEGREILLAPQCLENPRPDDLELYTQLSRHAVEHSPPVTAGLPISRAAAEVRSLEVTVVLSTADADVDPDLRSTKDVIGHRLRAIDGEIGHLEDLLIDPVSWDVAFAVAKTRNWLPGRHVVLERSVIRQMRWDANEVVIDLTREQIKEAPEFGEHLFLNGLGTNQDRAIQRPSR